MDRLILCLLVLLATAVAQQQVESPPPSPTESAPPAQSDGGGWRRFSEAAEPVAAPVPQLPPASQLTMPAGTWIKARVDQPLSSDRNRPGDTFTATLTQPVVVNGYVVARRGQTVAGRVSEAVRAGRRTGTSRLGFELIEIGLADGRQMTLRTELLEYTGATSNGRDAAAVGATTATGAAIGAAAGGGAGAGIGALAGAAAASIGVLVTRGRATEVYPESEITFRTVEPLTISTDAAPQAFQPVRQSDYERATLQSRRVIQPPPPVILGGGGWWGPGWWGPAWWGPGWGGGGYWWRGGGGHRRWRR